jgi:hypothetical protein
VSLEKGKPTYLYLYYTNISLPANVDIPASYGYAEGGAFIMNMEPLVILPLILFTTPCLILPTLPFDWESSKTYSRMFYYLLTQVGTHTPQPRFHRQAVK